MKKLHLICNAHIDPVWQWTWDEGIASAIATFKSAADLADEFDYIFCHGESLLYEAIEKSDPELFERIRALVRCGKWKITGGWYLQPDVLMPSGETILRHISVGRSYFKEKFDTVPTVAINFDSFGHSVGLVQLLKKTGHIGYIACRPNSSQFDYPSRFYEWRAPDGSSLIATETLSYNSALGKATQKITRCACGESAAMLGSDIESTGNLSTEDVDYVLWGVGNHGGGPSRKDLADIAALNIPDVQHFHSTPEALFGDDVRIGGVVEGSLVTCMPGCYTSMARVKQGYKRTESLFYAIERMISAAALSGVRLDLAPLAEAQKRLLLTTFHDSLPGTLVEEAEAEVLATLGSVERTLRDYRTDAFLALTLSERVASEGEYPILVFNYQPYAYEANIEAEFSLADQNWEDCIYIPHVYDEDGRELPSQMIKEASTLNLDWRKRIIFKGKLSPLGITRFNVRVEAVPLYEKYATRGTTIAKILEDEPLLCAPVGIELYSDTADPWGMSRAELVAMGRDPAPMRLMSEDEVMELFAASEPTPAERIIEKGDIYTAAEAAYTSGKSSAIVQYKLYENEPYVDLKITVEFLDKNKLLRVKIPIPADMRGGEAVGDGPFVWERKPDTEVCYREWLGVKCGDEIFAVINDGCYGGKVEGGYIHLSLIRGAGYCFHPIGERPLYPQDRYLPRIDCGRYTYNVRITRGGVQDIFRTAEEFMRSPYAQNIFPTGSGRSADKGTVCVSGDIITHTVQPLKDGCLIRLYNPSPVSQNCEVTVSSTTACATLAPHEVATVIYDGERLSTAQGTIPLASYDRGVLLDQE